jgi:hypothetical protein
MLANPKNGYCHLRSCECISKAERCNIIQELMESRQGQKELISYYDEWCSSKETNRDNFLALYPTFAQDLKKHNDEKQKKRENLHQLKNNQSSASAGFY